MSNFREMTPPMAPEWVSEKKLKLLIYEHITYSSEARNLEILNL